MPLSNPFAALQPPPHFCRIQTAPKKTRRIIERFDIELVRAANTHTRWLSPSLSCHIVNWSVCSKEELRESNACTADRTIESVRRLRHYIVLFTSQNENLGDCATKEPNTNPNNNNKVNGKQQKKSFRHKPFSRHHRFPCECISLSSSSSSLMPPPPLPLPKPPPHVQVDKPKSKHNKTVQATRNTTWSEYAEEDEERDSVSLLSWRCSGCCCLRYSRSCFLHRQIYLWCRININII